MKTTGLLILLATLTGSPAADWSQLRGPEGHGVAEAPGVPASLTEKDIAWSIELPGKGHSSPVAWGGRIFVTAEGAKPGTRHVLGIDAATGRELWRYTDTFEAYPQHQFNSYAASTPVADAERVYVSWLSGSKRVVLALDHAGKKMWERSPGHWQEQHGSSASPILVDGLLVVPNDHSAGKDAGFFALDPKTGATKWQASTQTERSSFSTPVVVTGPDGKKQLVCSSQPAALTAFDPATGRELWKLDHPVPDARAVGMPVVMDGIVFATVGQGGNGRGAVAVKPGSSDGKTPPKLVWEASNKIPYVPTGVATGGKLYLLNDGGLLSCVEPATGEQVWQERGPGKAYSSLVCVNGNLCAISRDGTLMTVKAADTFQPLGQLKLGDECQTTPAVIGGRLIVRTNTKLIALGSPPAPSRP